MNSLALLTFLMIFGFSDTVQSEDSVKLTVLYESYCSDSVRFIEDQLYTTWKDLNNAISLELVPFGFAQQHYEDGHFEFQCQHGPKECLGNTLHACALHQACGPSGSLGCPVSNLTKAIDYIHCVMQERDQWDASDQCASEAGLQPRAITVCATSDLGEVLESGYGNDTATFNKTTLIDYVPSILVNNTHTKEDQAEAEKDLRSLICKYIPQRCNSTTSTSNTNAILVE